MRPSSSCSSSGVCAHARHQVVEPHPQPATAHEFLDRAVVLRDLDELGVRRRVVAFGIDRQLIEVDRDRGQLAFDRVGLRRLLDDVDALVAVALELVLQQTRQRLRRLLDDVMLRVVTRSSLAPGRRCWPTRRNALKRRRGFSARDTTR